jgi:hypothetical protein
LFANEELSSDRFCPLLELLVLALLLQLPFA